MARLNCFKAYDVRGRLGTDLDDEIVCRIGRAYSQVLEARQVVVARDNRVSSAGLSQSLGAALVDEGCHVLDLGLAGTEEMYFAVNHFHADGGICVTASHNPVEFNGMKMVGRGAAPLDPATTFADIRKLAETGSVHASRSGGRLTHCTSQVRQAYVQRVLSFLDLSDLKPLRILVNAGHGSAGPTFDAIAMELQRRGAPFSFVRLFHEPDGTFPEGIPNPLLPENHLQTARAVRAAGADFGVAWDGDFDRCFFFDHTGEFVGGEFVVGLLAEAFLRKSPGARIVHDPRVIWNTRDVIAALGGEAIQSRTGHVYVKQAMRDHDAVYGGELSAHHYFRDFFHCDSGMIPWLLVAGLVGRSGPLRDLLADRKVACASSGELNFTSAEPDAVFQRLLAVLHPTDSAVDWTDGLSIDMGHWRMNLRASNTEPVMRLNVESRGDAQAIRDAVALVKSAIADEERR